MKQINLNFAKTSDIILEDIRDIHPISNDDIIKIDVNDLSESSQGNSEE